jgi:hypothetical protein
MPFQVVEIAMAREEERAARRIGIALEHYN